MGSWVVFLFSREFVFISIISFILCSFKTRQINPRKSSEHFIGDIVLLRSNLERHLLCEATHRDTCSVAINFPAFDRAD